LIDDGKIKLRNAHLNDVPTLLQWDQQPHVIAAGGGDDIVDYALEIKTNADWQSVWIGEINGRSIGVIFCIDPAREVSRYWGEIGLGCRALDIWIGRQQDLGCGYGTQMMQQALKLCFSTSSAHTVIIDPLQSNIKAIRFYKRLGFTFVENRTFGVDECAVYHIERTDWEN